MDRRRFISNVAKGVIIPTILPTGTLFAKTSDRKVKHVVFCLFAGGIRNFESIQKSEGNLMPYFLKGNESISKDIIQGIEFMPQPRPGYHTLESQGTLFKEFRYKSDETIHYSGHAVSITGNYKGNFQIMKPLTVPTVFEMYRKHCGIETSSLKSWWITDQAGPFSYLNYSNHHDYGPIYGANMLHPLTLQNLDLNRVDFFGNDTLKQIRHLKSKLGYDTNKKDNFTWINSEEEVYLLEKFIHQICGEVFSKENFNYWDLGQKANEDIATMYAATRVLKSFHPELMIVNMQHTDIGHSNFTQMCNNLQKADFALYQLWDTIQSDPIMKDNTVLIVAPEFGRNLNSSTVRDKYGRMSVDHTGDENSQKIFCLMLGPDNVIKKGNLINEEIGESIDIVPTIAELLGFRDKIPHHLLKGRVLYEAFT